MAFPLRIAAAVIAALVFLASGMSGTGTPPAAETASLAAPRAGVLFSVYPGGGTGEMNAAHRVSPEAVIERIDQLRDGRPFSVHLYAAWRDADEAWFWPYYDDEVMRYTRANLFVTYTIRYYPPQGHRGDVDGFVAFVRQFVRRCGANPGVVRYIIGNEGNVYENPEASDGPFERVREAIVAGTVAARAELDALRSEAEVGVNVAITHPDSDAAYLRDLVRLGGPRFQSAVSVVGIDVYPGIWPVGTGDAYHDMVTHLRDSRAILTRAGFGAEVKLDVLENGFPTPDEHDQARRLDEMVRAVLANYQQYGVVGYSWFDLWDADSTSPNRFGHYGLLRSDLTPKLAFERYRDLIRTANP